MTKKSTRADKSTNRKSPEAESRDDIAAATAPPEKEHDDAAAQARTADTAEPGPGEEVDDPLVILKTESEKNLQGWQRTLAEFQNYRKRVEREQKELRQKTTLETLTTILPIIDDFERALDNLPDDLRDSPWINGVALIQGKFKRLLETNEIEVLDPVGQPFDPNMHQAIGMDDSDEHESGHVIETLQKGYKHGDYVLRPAIVRVAN